MATKDEPKKNDKTPLVAVYKEKPDLRKKEPPLINLQVTNPVTYIKRWWKKVLGNEGIDFHLRIKPLTAIALAMIILTFGFGLGRITLSTKEPYITYTPPLPTPTPNPWRETAFTGILKHSLSEDRYYLLTASSEAIILEVPSNIPLSELVGKRIFSTGSYNQNTRTLRVSSTENLEILPLTITPIPTIEPSPTPTLNPTPTITPTPTILPSPQPQE